MNDVSGRLLLNVVYMHLLGRCEHVEKCTQRACVSACGYRQFREGLAAPALPCDIREDEVVRRRREALLRKSDEPVVIDLTG